MYGLSQLCKPQNSLMFLGLKKYLIIIIIWHKQANTHSFIADEDNQLA